MSVIGLERSVVPKILLGKVALKARKASKGTSENYGQNYEFKKGNKCQHTYRGLSWK